jgi:hypothetical protein
MRRTILLLSMLSVFISACSFKFATHQKPSVQNWPNGQLTLVSMGGAVFLANPHQDLAVILDKSPLGRARNIIVSAVDLPNAFLIETSDPEGRYLPSIKYVMKDERPLLKVENLQIPASMAWNTQTLGPIDLNQLKLLLIGTTTLTQLADFLQNERIAGSVNIIIPQDAFSLSDAPFDVYRTQAAMTILMLPSGQEISGGGALMSLAQSQPVTFLAVSTQMETLRSEGIWRMVQ